MSVWRAYSSKDPPHSHYTVARLDVRDVGANTLYDTDCLVTHDIAWLELQDFAVVESHVGTADACACDLDDGTHRVTWCRLVYVLHLYIALVVPNES